MSTYYFLALIAVLWPFIAKAWLKTSLNWQEVTINIGVGFLIVSVMFFGGRYSQVSDTEIWNGQITGKQKTRVFCEHSYTCNCTTDSKGNTTCDTCYEHSNDWDWDVFSTAGNFTINRIDRRGSDEPPRWTKVQKGQPVALEHRYTNYVQAVPQSLYHGVERGQYDHLPAVPVYPRVYDYHYAKRAIPVGISIPDIQQWNDDIAHILRPLGPGKEANITVIFVKTDDPMYRYKVENVWQGGEKNDVTVFLGTADGKAIAWVDVMTWALNQGNETLHVQLRDALLEIGTLDREQIISAIETMVRMYYDRPQMEDFEYLDSAIEPPLWLVILTAAVSMGISGFLTWYFHHHDVRFFKRSSFNRRRFRR
jgi:hypothetical protein